MTAIDTTPFTIITPPKQISADRSGIRVSDVQTQKELEFTYFVTTPPADAANIVASGLKPSAGIIGATIVADVITPTVVDPVIMFPMIPSTKGRKIGDRPVDAMPLAIASTAGVCRRI